MAIGKRRTSRRIKKRPNIRARKVRLAIACTPLERRRMKILAASEDKTLNEFVLESVRMRLTSCSLSHSPNDETIKALQDVEEGKNLVQFDSLEDFFKSLEK